MVATEGSVKPRSFAGIGACDLQVRMKLVKMLAERK